jgi:archaeosine-15-forming tRNA-guanine transglycosylase
MSIDFEARPGDALIIVDSQDDFCEFGRAGVSVAAP